MARNRSSRVKGRLLQGKAKKIGWIPLAKLDCAEAATTRRDLWGIGAGAVASRGGTEGVAASGERAKVLRRAAAGGSQAQAAAAAMAMDAPRVRSCRWGRRLGWDCGQGGRGGRRRDGGWGEAWMGRAGLPLRPMQWRPGPHPCRLPPSLARQFVILLPTSLRDLILPLPVPWWQAVAVELADRPSSTSTAMAMAAAAFLASSSASPASHPLPSPSSFSTRCCRLRRIITGRPPLASPSSAAHWNLSLNAKRQRQLVAALAPEAAAASLLVAGTVGVAATLLLRSASPSSGEQRRREKGEEEEEEEKEEGEVCGDCGGTGLCGRCKGEGFVFKELSEETVAKARKAAKNMATRYTAGLPTKWTYCNKCSSSRSCSTCRGSGRIVATSTST
ncbi:hypothetical protein ACP4OV_013590 [Aristida adscensionis]